MQQDANNANAAVTLLERAKPFVANWSIKKTLKIASYGGLGILASWVIRLIGTTSGTSALTAAGEVVLVLSAIAILLGLAGGIVHAHFTIIRSKDPEQRTIAKRILMITYGLVLAGFGLASFFGNGPAFLKPVGAVALLALFGGFVFIALLFFGIIRWDELMEAINYTPSGSKRLYKDLPTLDEYMAQNPREGDRQIACNRCGGTTIHQYGLTRESDDRRVFKCMTCNTFLYRKHGATY